MQTSTGKTTSFRYRADIDGLRAVAVVLVLLFHGGFGFSGGYIGVDVFFVISGFLITGIILHQQARGTFRLAEFWKRRVRRILPVASLVVALTLVAGCFLLLPQDLKELAESTIYQQLMVSNIYFWHHTGYFDGAAELKPLLHTWSLAVEEQFYLGYPLLLVLLSKCSRIKLTVCLLGLAAASFLLSCYFVVPHPGATFYSLPTRAWELLLGGILAACPWSFAIKRWQSNLLAWVGVGMIGYASLVFNSQTIFPGTNAALPCCGTLLLIISGTRHPTLINKCLSWRPIVFVGLISYSLYLWHWPLLVFQRYWFGDDISAIYRAAMLIASFGLAVVSWRFVETPLRARKQGWEISGRSLTSFALAAVLLVSIASGWIVLEKGIPNRLPTKTLAIISDSSPPEELKAMDRDAVACDSNELPLIGAINPSQKIEFILWGDSHARAVAKLCDRLAAEHHMQGAVATRSGTTSLVGKWHPRVDRDMVAWNDSVLQYIQRHQIKHVLVVNRWSVCAEQQSDVHQLAAALKSTIGRCHQLGAKVWIMRQVPEQLEHPQRGLALASWIGAQLPRGVTSVEHRQRQSLAESAFAKIDSVEFLSPDAFCFDVSGRSRLGTESSSFYRDQDHLSDAGALVLLQPLLDQVFADISNPLSSTQSVERWLTSSGQSIGVSQVSTVVFPEASTLSSGTSAK